MGYQLTFERQTLKVLDDGKSQTEPSGWTLRKRRERTHTETLNVYSIGTLMGTWKSSRV